MIEIRTIKNGLGKYAYVLQTQEGFLCSTDYGGWMVTPFLSYAMRFDTTTEATISRTEYLEEIQGNDWRLV